MARMRAKFAQYEREDQEAGAVRSFIYKEGERRHVGPSLFNTDNLQGTRPSQKKDPYRGYQTAGACSGFGFKKGDAYYVNEGLRCGCREKESRASILIYMLLCGCDPDSHGFSPSARSGTPCGSWRRMGILRLGGSEGTGISPSVSRIMRKSV